MRFFFKLFAVSCSVCIAEIIYIWSSWKSLWEFLLKFQRIFFVELWQNFMWEFLKIPENFVVISDRALEATIFKHFWWFWIWKPFPAELLRTFLRINIRSKFFILVRCWVLYELDMYAERALHKRGAASITSKRGSSYNKIIEFILVKYRKFSLSVKYTFWDIMMRILW